MEEANIPFSTAVWLVEERVIRILRMSEVSTEPFFEAMMINL